VLWFGVLMRIFTATVKRCVVFLFIYLWMIVISSKYAGANEVIAKGREVVRQHCARCHVVPDMNPFGGIGLPPSFAAMKWLTD